MSLSLATTSSFLTGDTPFGARLRPHSRPPAMRAHTRALPAAVAISIRGRVVVIVATRTGPLLAPRRRPMDSLPRCPSLLWRLSTLWRRGRNLPRILHKQTGVSDIHKHAGLGRAREDNVLFRLDWFPPAALTFMRLMSVVSFLCPQLPPLVLPLLDPFGVL